MSAIPAPDLVTSADHGSFDGLPGAPSASVLEPRLSWRSTGHPETVASPAGHEAHSHVLHIYYMEYVPIFALKITHMWANIPYMEHLG